MTVTVNGKRYLVSKITRAGKYGIVTVGHDYVNYWECREGVRFGPTRTGSRNSRKGTLGRTIFDAVDSGEEIK